jgi:predicted nuclease of predicted toxin-antitoxin system
MSRADDVTIARYARQHGFIVVSKDADYLQQLDAAAGVLQLVWVRTGNCRNQVLIPRFVDALDAMSRASATGQSVFELP